MSVNVETKTPKPKKYLKLEQGGTCNEKRGGFQNEKDWKWARLDFVFGSVLSCESGIDLGAFSSDNNGSGCERLRWTQRYADSR